MKFNNDDFWNTTLGLARTLAPTTLARLHLVLLTVCATSVTHSFAQTTETTEAQTYLRVANILPLESPNVSIAMQGKELWKSIRHGVYIPYTPISEPAALTVSSDGRELKTFPLKKGKHDTFHTLVIHQEAPQKITASLLLDTVPEMKDETGKPIRVQRFRGYFGGFPFPYRVSLGDLGQWTVAANKALLVDVPIPASKKAPGAVTVSHLSKTGVPVDLLSYVDFAGSDQCSVFVFQRGPTRPRILSVTDNVAPPKEPEEPAEE